MSFLVAIQSDNYTNPSAPEKYDASSPLWAEFLQRAGHRVKWVDVYRSDILEQLHGCDGFMWRWAHFNGMGRIARRLLPVLEQQLGLTLYPDWHTCWHYDDKLAQAYLLPALGIPTPKTWVWFERQAAKDWALTAQYPLVLKLAAGAGSANVRLILNWAEAHQWIDRLFGQRLVDLEEQQFLPLAWNRRLFLTAYLLLRGKLPTFSDNGNEPQSGYVLFQEFLPDNAFDTRVTVIGNRAFGFRRFNRSNDFRASGSGKLDWTPDAIDLNFVRLAFGTARSSAAQSCAVDGLYRNKEHVISEISYTYASWAVYQCPGHWELDGDAETGKLDWIEGQLHPEHAQVEDFISRLTHRSSALI